MRIPSAPMTRTQALNQQAGVENNQGIRFSGSYANIAARNKAVIEEGWTQYLDSGLLTMYDGKPVKAWELLELVRTCTAWDYRSPLLRGGLIALMLGTGLPAVIYCNPDYSYQDKHRNFSNFMNGIRRGATIKQLFDVIYHTPDTPNNSYRSREIQTALESLQSQGLVEYRGTFLTGDKENTKWGITADGKKALRFFKKLKAKGAQSSAGTAHSPQKVTAQAANRLNLDQLRVLQNNSLDDMTGWNLLYRLQELSQQKGTLARLLEGVGLGEGFLMKSLKITDPLKLRQALGDLERNGLIYATDNICPLWLLTDLGKKVLKKGDPFQSDMVDEALVNQYIDSEIQNLTGERTRRNAERKLLEDTYEKALASLQILKQTMAEEKQQGEALFQQSRSAAPEEKGHLEQQALEKAYLLERLQHRLKAEVQIAYQQKKDLERVRVCQMDWEGRYQKNLQQLEFLKLANKNAQTKQAVNQLMKDMQKMGDVDTQNNLDGKLDALNQRIQLETSDLDRAMRELMDDMSLEATRISQAEYLEKAFGAKSENLNTSLPPTLSASAHAPQLESTVQ